MEEIVPITIQALKKVRNLRYYRSERGFVAEFYSRLRNLLDAYNVLPEHAILESEVQKRHADHYGVTQRPDLLIHIPLEAGLTQNANENNFVVYAFKLRGRPNKAAEDYLKLEQMFEHLNYQVGIFINISSYPDILLGNYNGEYQSRIHEFSVGFIDDNVHIIHSYFVDGVLNSVDRTEDNLH